MFGSSIQPCKCPLCYSRIVSLKPETPGRIQPADDDADALKKVHQYNGLYSRGAIGGAFHVMFDLSVTISIFACVITKRARIPDFILYLAECTSIFNFNEENVQSFDRSRSDEMHILHIAPFWGKIDQPFTFCYLDWILLMIR